VTQATESGRDVDPGDVAMAVNAYRALYEHVINDRTADADWVAAEAVKEIDNPGLREQLEKARKGEVPPPWP